MAKKKKGIRKSGRSNQSFPSSDFVRRRFNEPCFLFPQCSCTTKSQGLDHVGYDLFCPCASTVNVNILQDCTDAHTVASIRQHLIAQHHQCSVPSVLVTSDY